MKKLLLLVPLCICIVLGSYGQTLSVGVVGGIFSNGQMEQDYRPAVNYSFEYTPQDPQFTIGISATLNLLQHLRLEVSATSAEVANTVQETYIDPQTSYVSVREGKLKYGNTNYQLAFAPAYRFNFGDVHPYLGAESGLAIPAGGSDKLGWFVGGRLGLDVLLTDKLYATGSINMGQMMRATATGRDTDFSYYRILLGVSYILL